MGDRRRLIVIYSNDDRIDDFNCTNLILFLGSGLILSIGSILINGGRIIIDGIRDTEHLTHSLKLVIVEQINCVHDAFLMLLSRKLISYSDTACSTLSICFLSLSLHEAITLRKDAPRLL